jgi:hypothetical protein
MKKIIALLMALCLICVSAAALAEATATDGSPVKLDGFTMNLEAGAYYQLNDKKTEQVYVTVYPYVAGGDQSTNFNAVWAGATGTITVEEVRAQVPDLKEQMKAGFEQYGYTLDALEYGDPVDGTLAGEACIILDSKMRLSANGTTLDISQRQFYVGGKGFIMTASAADTETMETVTALMDSVIAWD